MRTLVGGVLVWVRLVGDAGEGRKLLGSAGGPRLRKTRASEVTILGVGCAGVLRRITYIFFFYKQKPSWLARDTPSGLRKR